jgi:hypothetical protein
MASGAGADLAPRRLIARQTRMVPVTPPTMQNNKPGKAAPNNEIDGAKCATAE